MILKQNLNKLLIRWITGLILATIVIFCVISGGIPIMLIVGAVIYLGSKEYVTILNHKGFYPFFSIMMAMSAIIIILTTLHRTDLLPIVLTGGVISAFLAVLFYGKQPYIANVATTVLGFIYCGWLPCTFILIRQINSDGLGLLRVTNNDGVGFLFLVFFVVVATDIGGYFFGKQYGKIPLSPVISPSKTVEGSIGGALLAITVSLVIGWAIHLTWYHSLILGVLITIFAQLGDLSESLIKRDAGVKDSGTSLPGHGGFMDRCDSYVFSVPVAYYYLKYFVVSDQLFLDFVDFIKKVTGIIGF